MKETNTSHLAAARTGRHLAFLEVEQGRYDSAQAHAMIAVSSALIALIERLDQTYSILLIERLDKMYSAMAAQLDLATPDAEPLISDQTDALFESQ